MDLPSHRLDDQLAVAPQLTPEAMAAAAAAGYRSVINNRPDHEGGPDQPTNAAMEAAARAAGLQYAFLPVLGAYQTPEQAQAMAALMRELPKPVLAFCRTGTRSARLYAMARQLGD